MNKTARIAITMGAVISLALTLGGPAAAQSVYRHVDENGVVNFSDRPQSGATETVDIAVSRTDNEAIRAQQQSEQELAAVRQIREGQDAEDAATAKQDAAEAHAQRQANCEQARARSESYETHRRLYKPLPNGEREYLSDAELDEARVEARRTAAEWCD